MQTYCTIKLDMENLHVTNALRLIQAAEDLKSSLAGEFSSVHGLSVNEFFLMLHLNQATRHRLARVELARRMHVSASTVTRMASPMEKIGLLLRETDERDARLAFVVLSEAGQTKVSEAMTTFSKRAGYLFKDRWNEDDAKHLSELLLRLLSGNADPLA